MKLVRALNYYKENCFSSAMAMDAVDGLLELLDPSKWFKSVIFKSPKWPQFLFGNMLQSPQCSFSLSPFQETWAWAAIQMTLHPRPQIQLQQPKWRFSITWTHLLKWLAEMPGFPWPWNPCKRSPRKASNLESSAPLGTQTTWTNQKWPDWMDCVTSEWTTTTACRMWRLATQRWVGFLLSFNSQFLSNSGVKIFALFKIVFPFFSQSFFLDWISCSLHIRRRTLGWWVLRTTHVLLVLASHFQRREVDLWIRPGSGNTSYVLASVLAHSFFLTHFFVSCVKLFRTSLLNLVSDLYLFSLSIHASYAARSMRSAYDPRASNLLNMVMDPLLEKTYGQRLVTAAYHTELEKCPPQKETKKNKLFHPHFTNPPALPFHALAKKIWCPPKTTFWGWKRFTRSH